MVRPRARLPRFLAAALVIAAAALGAAAATVDFEREIRPILAEQCYSCHGNGERKGGLSLQLLADAELGGDSGKPAIVPGNSAASELIARITSADPSERMPQKKDPLSPEQVALLKAWIDTGASWPVPNETRTASNHWSFKRPVQAVPPAVRQADWVRNPIDAFVLARIEQAGLKPAPEADRRTLIRRLNLDLIGLPPAPEDIEAFVLDTRPGAYERLVERLLASPHYGERQAIPWLDAARYADTNGFEKDRKRSIWPYRDWVIQAFNRDMPYDQFIVEQLAGDLLPGASVEQRVATGFLRNSMLNEEGGVDVEEFRYEAMVDRTNTAATVFLGLTMGCAQCHTHKFDPITQREYFAFYAFLNNTDDVELELPDGEIAARRAEIERQIAEIESNLESRFPADEIRVVYDVMSPVEAVSAGGAELERLGDGSIRASGEAPDKDTYTVASNVGLGEWKGLYLELIGDGETGPGRAGNGNFVLSELEARVEPLRDGEGKVLKFARAEANAAQAGHPVGHAIDGKVETGWAGGVDAGSPDAVRIATFWFEEPLSVKGPIRLVTTLTQEFGDRHTIGRFRLALVREEIKTTDEPEDMRRGRHLARKLAEWEERTAKSAANWAVLDPISYTSKFHATFKKLPDRSLLVKGDIPNTDTYEIGFRTDLTGITALRIEALPDPSLPGGGPGRGVIMSDGDFLLSEVTASTAPWDDPEAVTPAPLQNGSHSYAGEGRSAALCLDGRMDTGWGIKGQAGKPHAAVFEFAEPVGHESGTLLKLALDQYYVHQHTLGRLRVSATTDERPLRAAGVPADIEAILVTPDSERSDEQRRALKRYFLSIAPELAEHHKRIDELKKSMPQFARTLVLEERDEPRVTRLHHRGEFLSPREAVTPAIPAVLPPLPEHAPPNRLSFARWIASKENPLTARVAVNRMWQQFFGRGIVASVDDFGTQGERPTHPELLDWLAVEFMRRGWSMKELARLIVTSATYRQSSVVTPELLQADPQNELLARAPRFRIDAELVRDVALASSGLLSEKIGGPSVFPPMPEGVLSLVYDSGWGASEGGDRYRRGLYTHIKRTLPYPAATTFDAPTRDSACVRRVRSNTPLQALTLLNDTVFMEAARAMAERVVKERNNLRDRLEYAFELCVSRPPDDQELSWVMAFFEAQRERMSAVASIPETLSGPEGDRAEQAAWTMVCRALLNLDETITRG